MDNARKVCPLSILWTESMNYCHFLFFSSVPSTYGGTNWRRMVLPEMLEVPEEFKRILAMPVLVELDGETGAIRAVKVSKSEPEWSVNYKKGIVSLFQVKMESSLSSNMVSISSHIH